VSSRRPLIVCYHALSDDWDASLAVTPDLFSTHMHALYRRGFQALTFTEAERRRRAGDLPPRTVVVTFDDGYASTALAAPILADLGWAATVFILPGYTDSGERFAWKGPDAWLATSHAGELTPLDWEGVRRLVQAGWEVGAHTLTHPWLTSVDDATLERELVAARQALISRLGRCDSLAYPYGASDERVVAATRNAGYTAACTLDLSDVDEPFRRPRIGLHQHDQGLRARLKLGRVVHSAPVRYARRAQAAVRSSRTPSPRGKTPGPKRASQRPLRVLMFTPIARAETGVGRVALDLAVALADDAQFAVSYCASRAPMANSETAITTLDHHQIPFVTLGRRGRFDIYRSLRLYRVLRSNRIDVLHAHSHTANVVASVVGRAAGVPVVIATEHTWSFTGQPVRRLLDRAVVSRLADVFVAVSDADHRRIISVVGASPVRVRTIINGYQPRDGRDQPAERPLRETFAIPADAPLLGTICVLRPQKALDVMIDAFATVHRQRPDAHLVIVGFGKQLDALRQHAAERGVADHVHFAGQRNDATAVLAEFDMFLLSSTFEGTPLAVLEAMAARRPIVATAVGGVPELAPDGDCALLVAPGDPDAIAHAVTRLLDQPALADHLAAAAHARVTTQLGFAQTLAQWALLYRELARGTARQPAS
jgi:glycosyltransferase involved in cell wall biosynthesis/peptidoglycan/xylan/chitin deacetylase (PgdA/CDA1 family)